MQDILITIFVQPFLNLLFLIYGILPGHDFGVAVIILTILIRLVLWPLTARQLHSQKKMQALQPEIAKVKAKAAGDKQKESQLLMELYKEKEISPFSACLPLLLQFPFLIALYFVFQTATQGADAVANLLYPFVKNLPDIQAIIQDPSSFSLSLFGIVNMAKPSIAFAILAGLTQFIQVKMLQPKKVDSSAPKDPQTQATALMNYTFPILTTFIAWNLPAALPLYWSVTNGISILQQFLISRHEVEEMEEVVVVKKQSKTNVSPSKTKALPKPKSKKAKKGKK